jgi:hypothetical protein
VRFGLLADQLLDLAVRDLEPELVGDRLEYELAGDRERGLGAKLGRRAARRLAGELEVGLGADATALERAREAVQELAVRASTSGPAASTPVSRTSRSAAAARNCVSACSSSTSRIRPLDVGAQLLERVELARGARQLVVERGSTFSFSSFSVTDALAVEPSRAAKARPPSSRPARRR